MRGRRGVVGVGRQAEGRPQTVAPCSQQAIEMYTNHSIDRDSHWQQSGTQPNLISAPQ